MEAGKMSKKIVQNVNFGMTWTSYMGSTYAALTGAGLWEGEIWKLMGMTGMAFHFILHETVCPSSVTVYDWMAEHLSMMDRIGVHSDFYQSWYDNKSGIFALRQKDAVRRIKESIDRGVCVTVWAPARILEFGVVYGYDDEDGIFHVIECSGRQADPLLYGNLGKSEVPMLAYQIYKGKVDIDKLQVYRDSLQYAVSEWNKDFHVQPAYASGRKAYGLLLKALEEDRFDTFGLAYSIAVYQDSKQCIAQYLEFLSSQEGLKGLEKAAGIYKQIAERYKAMCELFPFSGENGSGCSADRGNAPALLKLARECFELEEKAVALIEACLKSE
jgi:hypothetical protein